MTPEPVLIADSSPLIALARINQLDLLHRLALRVIVPPGVWEEGTNHSMRPGPAL